jgi:adenylate kinase
VIFNPPKVEGVCNKDGGELYQREDDNPDTVRQRLKVFWRQTNPLIDYYRSKEILEEVDGDQSINEVQAALQHLVRGFV